MTVKSNFSDRIRFSWAFHDGAADGARPLYKHYDRVYLAGYKLGQDARNAGEYDSQTTTSDAAWKQHNSPESKQKRRMSRYH